MPTYQVKPPRNSVLVSVEELGSNVSQAKEVSLEGQFSSEFDYPYESR